MKKECVIELSSDWVLGRRDEDEMPADVIEKWAEKNDLELKDKGFTEIILVGDPVPFKTEDELKESLISLMKAHYGEKSGNVEASISCSIKDSDNKEKPETKSDNKKDDIVKKDNKKAETDQKDIDEYKTMMSQLDSIVGAEDFVKMCRDLIDIIPVLKEHDSLDIIRNQAYLFSIDDGDGLSSNIKVLQDLLNLNGVFDLKGEPTEVVFHKNVTESYNPEDEMNNYSSARNKLLCIDLSEWIGDFSKPKFKEFLRLLYRNMENAVYVFRIPYLQEDMVEESAADIRDVLRLNTVSFKSLNEDNTKKIAEQRIKEKGFSVENDVWELFERRIVEEKSDGKYYGFRTIGNVVDDMLLYKARAIVSEKNDDCIIHKNDLKGFIRSAGKETTAAEDMEALSGMDEVKKKIIEIADQMQYARDNGSEVDMPTMHMRFVGAPGTGKTTMARIVGKLFHERGLLSKGYFLEYTGGDFMGSYVGQTAPLVKKICQGAYGSVLFIDEAYTLTGYEGRSYSQEAIETLLAQMENHRKDLVVIMAGYEEDMEKLMETNTGLRDRMPNVIKFENYSREMLFDIYKKLLERSSFKASNGVLEEVNRYFMNMDQAVLDDPSFANGRYVRNLFEMTWGKMVSRSTEGGENSNTIIPEDFRQAVNVQKDELNRKRKVSGYSGIKLGFAVE